MNIHYDVPVSRCIGREILVSIKFLQKRHISTQKKTLLHENLTSSKRKAFFILECWQEMTEFSETELHDISGDPLYHFNI